MLKHNVITEITVIFVWAPSANPRRLYVFAY